MMRVLFVDDEPLVLTGLQRQLRPRRHEWKIACALGGEAALVELEAAPFDVIVTDLCMPGMDGTALLRAVQQRYPTLMRLVLSGNTDQNTVAQAAAVAHQCLSKPCDPELLQQAIQQVGQHQAPHGG